MEAYNGMDIEKAGSMLEEALRVALEAGVMGPLLAQTNLNLGIVYVGGLSDNDGGVKYFMDAICADPSVQLDPLTSTPDVQSVFQVAAQRVQQMGCPQGGPMIAPGAAAGTMPMQGMPPGGYAAAGGAAPPNMDNELPPGWSANDPSAGSAKDFRRAFVQLALTLGMSHVEPGMLADRKPPYDHVFVSVLDGGYVNNLFNPDGSLMTVDGTPNGMPTWNVDNLRFPGTSFKDAMGNEIGLQSENAWEPDADSTDGLYDVETESGGMQFKHYLPVGGHCPKDGKPTGPGPRVGDSTVQLDPSRYCVRVKKAGFANQLAMRANAGYFITRDVSLAAVFRFQFSAGEGDFSHILLGARVEYMFTKTKPLGLMVSGFLGGTFGQIQAQPHTDNANGNEPWIKSGLQGVHIGSNVRYRFTPNFGVFMAPEFDLQFPTLLWNIDFAFLGVEAAL
ncbi:MAG TPA: hypothetical protein VJV78_07165 [Polyangiales bacterium]|nr:hypothetical protein [Polyangiales bacterium]